MGDKLAGKVRKEDLDAGFKSIESKYRESFEKVFDKLSDYVWINILSVPKNVGVLKLARLRLPFRFTRLVFKSFLVTHLSFLDQNKQRQRIKRLWNLAFCS